MDEATRQSTGEALGRVVSGVSVLTARSGERETGMLASWIQQASFEPPMISVALKKGRYIGQWIADSGMLAVSIVGEGQKELLRHFGKGFKPDEPAFDGVRIARHSTGLPVLADALGFLECRVAGQCNAGDHTVFVAEIIGGGLNGTDGKPMVHVRRSGFNY